MDHFFRPKRTSSRRKTTPAEVQARTSWRSLSDARPAETVRQRRERRLRRKAGGSQGRTFHSSATLPPVLTRAEQPILPIRERRYERPKRQVKMALNVPGAEIHLPALPVVHLNWRLASGMIAALMAAILFHWWSSPSYRVNAPEIIGIQRITPNDIQLVTGLSGESIFTIDAQRITDELKRAFPDLKSIAVEIRLPANVIITVEERQPRLAWQQDSKVIWIDAEGAGFPARGQAEGLVAVEAKDPPPGTQSNAAANTVHFDPRWVEAFEGLAAKAPPGTALVYNAARGMGWNDPQGWQVFFGTELNDLDTKLMVYEALVARLQAEGVTPTLISMEFVHAPYYRTER